MRNLVPVLLAAALRRTLTDRTTESGVGRGLLRLSLSRSGRGVRPHQRRGGVSAGQACRVGLVVSVLSRRRWWAVSIQVTMTELVSGLQAPAVEDVLLQEAEEGLHGGVVRTGSDPARRPLEPKTSENGQYSRGSLLAANTSLPNRPSRADPDTYSVLVAAALLRPGPSAEVHRYPRRAAQVEVAAHLLGGGGLGD